MSVTIKDNISGSLAKIEKKIANIAKEAYKEFVKETPKKSGNARRSTKLVGNKIVAGYAYAKRLDEGYSKQSPEGMTKPTEAFVQKRMEEILRGK